MMFFQFTTDGTLFKPVNLTNLVLQNSYIIIMALGMLLVIVAGHIDLSVGSVAGFIGAVAAVLMVQYHVDSIPRRAASAWPSAASSAAAQGYLDRLSSKIPSFIVTLAGMLVFKGLCARCCWAAARSVRSRPSSSSQSAGFIPDVIGPITIGGPVNAACDDAAHRRR